MTLHLEDPGTTAREHERLEERVRRLEAALVVEREAHAATRRTLQQFEAIIDRAPLAIYLKDADHQYLLVNREYEKLSTHQREHILGKEDPSLFPPEVAALFRAQDQDVVAQRQAIEFRETIPLPDGVHTFITSKFPVLTGADGRLGVAGICTEITALERARAQLEQAQAEVVRTERLAALGELAAVIAHEVRNPLGVIFNSLSTLKRLPAGTPDAPALLGIIGEEAERLNQMVGTLLDLVRPLEARPTPTALLPVLTMAIEAARALDDRDAEVRLEVDAHLPRLALDAQLLRQAVCNLVDNALHAAGRQGPVWVRAGLSPTRDHLLVSVADDGDGVPVGMEDRIFAPFFTTRARGTGLGLAVVKRVVEAHHGAVRLSTTPGGGATFTLELPVTPGGP